MILRPTVPVARLVPSARFALISPCQISCDMLIGGCEPISPRGPTSPQARSVYIIVVTIIANFALFSYFTTDRFHYQLDPHLVSVLENGLRDLVERREGKTSENKNRAQRRQYLRAP